MASTRRHTYWQVPSIERFTNAFALLIDLRAQLLRKHEAYLGNSMRQASTPDGLTDRSSNSSKAQLRPTISMSSAFTLSLE